jgi:hypothetical protein
LFSVTVESATASARLYALVETAKANAIEPYADLRHVFTELPRTATIDDLEALPPRNVPRTSLIFQLLLPPRGSWRGHVGDCRSFRCD